MPCRRSCTYKVSQAAKPVTLRISMLPSGAVGPWAVRISSVLASQHVALICESAENTSCLTFRKFLMLTTMCGDKTSSTARCA
jgi:hypothetical protein